MKRQPICNFLLAGVSITSFGFTIPSPFCSLTLENSEITTFTSWNLVCTVSGDYSKKVNVAAFEGLLYSAAQAASAYDNASGIPVSFMFGWLNEDGTVDEYASYQGFTLKFTVSTSGTFLIYNIEGFASLALQTAIPALQIPAVSGIVQPSAIVEALAKATKADYYYQLDIDHNDAPTYINHGALTTSFNAYVRGSYDADQDSFEGFPGLVKLSKSYNANRDASGLQQNKSVKKLSQVLNNRKDTPVTDFLKRSIIDSTIQSASFSYWIDEPTQTSPGIIHYKNDANILGSTRRDTLEYGTSNTNVLSISGKYNGVAYNMTNMRFSSIGFTLDASGNNIVQDARLVNSWSAEMGDVFRSVDVVNDINAIASQFSGDFTVTIPGSVKTYTIAQPISLLVMSGGSISPITGIYNIISVSHSIGATFTTTLRLQRLTISTANQVASSQGIFVSGSLMGLPNNSINTTTNVVSPYKVEFPDLYPNFTDMFMV